MKIAEVLLMDDNYNIIKENDIIEFKVKKARVVDTGEIEYLNDTYKGKVIGFLKDKNSILIDASYEFNSFKLIINLQDLFIYKNITRLKNDNEKGFNK